MPAMDPTDKVALRERQLRDFNAIPRYISGPAFLRFQQESPSILAEVEESSDPNLEEEVKVAQAAFEAVVASKPAAVNADYYSRWGAAGIALEEARDAAKAARKSVLKDDPVGRLFKRWEAYYPENTAENQ